jgi:hypothetical protein
MAGRTRIGPLASAKRWLNNVVNEAGEATNAGEAYVKAKYVFDRLPAPAKTQDKFKTLAEMKERVRQERGQYFGALLQNRQYDGSGKQIKAKKKK